MSVGHVSAEAGPGDGLLERLAPAMPVPLCPELVAHQAPDVHALWRAWEEESREARGVPYWATVWPAAQVLARGILDGLVVVAAPCGARLAPAEQLYRLRRHAVEHET